MTLEYYTYTQGAAITKALNAIATFFASQSFASMMSISIMIGAAMTYAHFVASRNPKHIYVWAIVFTLVPSMLIKQTVTMQVIDKTEPSSAYSVGNVPYLVALPTWFFSSMMVGSADAIESIFTTVDDERYGRTGMMFGSELYQLSRQSDLKDIGLRRLWNDFFQNCVVGDIQINKKYTWNALMNAKDVFAFLDGQTMSPLRGVILNDIQQTFKTCQEVYPELKGGFNVSAADELDLIATYLHGEKAAMYRSHIQNSLSNSYQKFIKVSDNAVNVLKHNMAINATRYSINTMDPSASAMNYAYTSNKMQQTSMWATLGMQAREFIPMMHTMLFTLFSCLGFMVAAVAVIPAFTKMVLTNYIKTFAYLATWPSLFALLNAIMTWTLEAHSSATANPMQGLSLSNANALDALHMRYGYMAGFLMMSIPVLAGKLLQGGAAVAQAMNYQLAGMINSTNARVSAASSTGNLDFGNLQMQNHSFLNMSGNQFSDNTLLKSGMARARQGGSSTTDLQSENGHNIYATGETASKQQWQSPPSNLQQRSRINDSHYTEKADRSQHSNNFNDNLSENFQDRTHWSEQRGSNNTVAQTEQPDLLANQSASKMASEVENITATASQTDNPELTYAGKESKALDNESNSLPEPRMCTPSNPLGLSEDEIKAEALARAGDPTANRIDDLLNSPQPASMHRLEPMQKGWIRQHADGLEANRKNKGHESGQETAILSPPSNASTRRRKSEVPANLFSKKENGELTIDSAYLPKKKNDTTTTLGPESSPLPEPRMCTPSNPMGLSQDEIKAEALARAGDPTANRIDDLLNSPQAASEHRLEPTQPTSSEPDKRSILSTEQMRDAFFRSPLGLAYTGYQLGQQIPNVVNEVSENQGVVVTLGASANGQIGKLTGSVEGGVWVGADWRNELNFNSGLYDAVEGGGKIAHSNLAFGAGPAATLFSSPDYNGALSGEFKSCDANYNDFSVGYIEANDGNISGYAMGYDKWSFSAVPLKHDPALQCGVGTGDYTTWGEIYQKLEEIENEYIYKRTK